jgi:hypothetical protein
MAYPRSPLYRLAVEKGWPLPESWSGFSRCSHDCLPLPTEKLSAAAVLGFRVQTFHSYFASRRYLDVVTQKFGWDTRAHVVEMARHRLRHRLLEDEPVRAQAGGR